MSENRWRPFEEAREFVRSLRLKSQAEWKIYKISNEMPSDIPKQPMDVYKGKWISWPNWLGTKNFRNIKWKTFEEARKFVHTLNLKSRSQWKKYCKSGDKPEDIPSCPDNTYKKTGDWISWGDFLGSGLVATYNIKYRSFKNAREFARSLGLKSKTEWKKAYGDGIIPEDIPKAPDSSYRRKGVWTNWKDFLGYSRLSNNNRNYISFNIKYRSFKNAREFARSLGLKSKTEWEKYRKSGDKPEDIPSCPDNTYKKTGDWISWGDFLGSGNIKYKGEYKTFEEAKNFIKGYNLKSIDDWLEYKKTRNKPNDIPAYPNEVYKEWKGWADFLGYLGNGNAWSKYALLSYLEQMKSYLHVCSIPQLMTIIESNGLYRYLTKEKIKKIQDTCPDTEERVEITEEVINELTSTEGDELTEVDDINTELTEEETGELINNVPDGEDEIDEEDKTELTEKTLRALDNNAITASLDDERVQFIVRDTINSMWYDVLNNRLDTTKIGLLEFETNLPEKIKSDFINEYNEVMKLKLPNGWTYQYQPLLMQKLISYRLSQHKRYGNWSGVGAGKTIGAILAGRHVGAKNTLIITFNSTIGKEDERGWTKEIRDSFADSRIYTKLDKNVKFDNKYHNYLVLNYETFQQKGSANFVIDLLEKNKFDYIILDEVQSVKQRTKNDESKRREVIFGLVGKVRELNPNYYLLAMSATPVINNLTEAKSLIELIDFTTLDDVNTRPNISNCIELFRRLTNCGIRHKNIEDNILKNNKYTILPVDASEYYEEASELSYDDVLEKERLMLIPKLEAVKPYLNTSKGKTVIYTHYVGGIEDNIYEYLTNLGYKVGMYTGSSSKYNRDSTLSEFINGDYDILIGSRPIGTGVNGLQFVSDRLIILSLPWTNAELEQLVGRVNRKGSIFRENGVDVIIPLVRMDGDKKIIRWDEHKYNTVTYKATIANAVVDGIIPEKILAPKELLLEKAEENLNEWIDRLNRGDILTVDREELKTVLYPDITDEEERRRKINSELQEFNRLGKTTKSSTMNRKFNDDPESWHRYHNIRRESMKDWEEIPYEHIAKQITYEEDRIIDFGCGDNQFKTCVKNNVTSVDHIAIDDSVIACDMKDLSKHVYDESHDIAVFSLSLWGTNYPDYLKEAHRVLMRKGMVYIAEPSKDYESEEKQAQMKSLLNEIGFKLVGNIDIKNKFTYITAIKI